MKYTIFAMLLFSRIYSTDVTVNGIKIAEKRQNPIPKQELLEELKSLDSSADPSKSSYVPFVPNDEQQMEILNRDVLKLITVLPYSPDLLERVVIRTGGKNNITVTWGDILNKLKDKVLEAENASMTPVKYFFPKYTISDPVLVLRSQRPYESKDALASFGADLVICDMPVTRTFIENHILDTYKSAWDFLDFENYKFFDPSDRDLYGNYTPQGSPETHYNFTRIKISRMRYAVATVLESIDSDGLQEAYYDWLKLLKSIQKWKTFKRV